MRFATQIPPEITTIIARAGEDQSSWPSIHDPAPASAPVEKYYDEHMQQEVPSLQLYRGVHLPPV